jgi:hypothetical protein
MGKSSLAPVATLADEAALAAGEGDDAVGAASGRVASAGLREHAATATGTMPPTRMAIALEEEGMARRA